MSQSEIQQSHPTPEDSGGNGSIFSRKNVMGKVVVPILAEFFTMIIHTFWGSMMAMPIKPVYVADLNRYANY